MKETRHYHPGDVDSQSQFQPVDLVEMFNRAKQNALNAARDNSPSKASMVAGEDGVVGILMARDQEKNTAVVGYRDPQGKYFEKTIPLDTIYSLEKILDFLRR